MWQRKKWKGRCVDYGNRNAGDTGSGGNCSQWIPDKKYIFFESDMEEKEQRIFYCASFFMIAILFLIFGKDTASLAELVP